MAHSRNWPVLIMAILALATLAFVGIPRSPEGNAAPEAASAQQAPAAQVSQEPANVTVTTAPPTPKVDGMCGKTGVAPAIKHVIVIFMENESYSTVVGNPAAKYQNETIAAQCGTATNMRGITHYSLANYLSFAAGRYTGKSINDCKPGAYCSYNGESLFSQVEASGQTWRVYAEDMPSNCFTEDVGKYMARHNPALYMSTLKSCTDFDVPAGDIKTQTGPLYEAVKTGNLPNFTFIAPNATNNSHGMAGEGPSVTQNENTGNGDVFLSKLIPILTQGKNYLAGDTAIFITNDEGKGGKPGENCAVKPTPEDCQIPAFVIYPYTPAGLKVEAPYSHYSLTKTVEELLGLPVTLGHASDADVYSMTRPFKLALGK